MKMKIILKPIIITLIIAFVWQQTGYSKDTSNSLRPASFVDRTIETVPWTDRDAKFMLAIFVAMQGKDTHRLNYPEILNMLISAQPLSEFGKQFGTGPINDEIMAEVVELYSRLRATSYPDLKDRRAELHQRMMRLVETLQSMSRAETIILEKLETVERFANGQIDDLFISVNEIRFLQIVEALRVNLNNIYPVILAATQESSSDYDDVGRKRELSKRYLECLSAGTRQKSIAEIRKAIDQIALEAKNAIEIYYSPTKVLYVGATIVKYEGVVQSLSRNDTAIETYLTSRNKTAPREKESAMNLDLHTYATFLFVHAQPFMLTKERGQFTVIINRDGACVTQKKEWLTGDIAVTLSVNPVTQDLTVVSATLANPLFKHFNITIPVLIPEAFESLLAVYREDRVHPLQAMMLIPETDI